VRKRKGGDLSCVFGGDGGGGDGGGGDGGGGGGGGDGGGGVCGMEGGAGYGVDNVLLFQLLSTSFRLQLSPSLEIASTAQA
jgi:hypothetical protein